MKFPVLATVVAVLAFLALVEGHSWLACSDYRGPVDYYDDTKCFAYPREWASSRPNSQAQIAKGYQIADDTGYNFMSGLSCNLPMKNPVSGAYTANRPMATYEQGKMYCLAWPMKNHGAAKCTNEFIPDTKFAIFYSGVNPSSDPTQDVFNQRQAKDFFGTHVNGQIDCLGFQRSPKFCDSTGQAMGTGCFMVGANQPVGRYVYQWYWKFNAGDSGPYVTCWDAEVVAANAGPVKNNGVFGLSGESTIKDNLNGVNTEGSTCAANWKAVYAAGGSSVPAPAPTPGTPTPAPTPAPVTPTPAPTPAPAPAPAGAIPIGQQCYGKPGSGSQCSTLASGCCGVCVSGAVCGGTADDNMYWKGCRVANSGADRVTCTAPGTGPSPAPAPAPTTPTVGYSAGKTTRYWDCCKPSCAWGGKAAVSKPVDQCSKDGSTRFLSDIDTHKNACDDGGDSFMCTNQMPWVVSDDLAMGYAAVSIKGLTEAGGCCGCFEVVFTSGPVTGKRMIVQSTNTGADLGENHFDIQMPGGGVGIFTACTKQWNAPTDGWGQRYGGVTSLAACDTLPAQLQPGCKWRYGWFMNADNPSMNFRRVRCPAELIANTKCTRNDDLNYPVVSLGTAPPTPAPTPVDPCAGVMCGTFGRCSFGKCVCSSGYTGTTCSTAPAISCPANCGALNRLTCSAANTCGLCKTGYKPNKAITAGDMTTSCSLECDLAKCSSENRLACTAPNTCGPCKAGFTGSPCSSTPSAPATGSSYWKFAVKSEWEDGWCGSVSGKCPDDETARFVLADGLGMTQMWNILTPALTDAKVTGRCPSWVSKGTNFEFGICGSKPRGAKVVVDNTDAVDSDKFATAGFYIATAAQADMLAYNDVTTIDVALSFTVKDVLLADGTFDTAIAFATGHASSKPQDSWFVEKTIGEVSAAIGFEPRQVTLLSAVGDGRHVQVTLKVTCYNSEQVALAAALATSLSASPLIAGSILSKADLSSVSVSTAVSVMSDSGSGVVNVSSAVSAGVSFASMIAAGFAALFTLLF